MIVLDIEPPEARGARLRDTSEPGCPSRPFLAPPSEGRSRVCGSRVLLVSLLLAYLPE